MEEDRERRLRLEGLFSQHAAAVGAYAARRTDATSAEDVLMEVFVIACRRLDAIPADPLPWLLGCARRVLANQRRGTRRAGALVDRIAANAESSSARDDESPIALAVAQLPEGDREVLFLSAWEGLEPAQIATVLGYSGVAARVRLHRARRRLAAAMELARRPVSSPREAKAVR